MEKLNKSYTDDAASKRSSWYGTAEACLMAPEIDVRTIHSSSAMHGETCKSLQSRETAEACLTAPEIDVRTIPSPSAMHGETCKSLQSREVVQKREAKYQQVKEIILAECFICIVTSNECSLEENINYEVVGAVNICRESVCFDFITHLQINGNLRIENTNLEKLPPSINTSGSLILHYNQFLKDISDSHIKVFRNFNISYNPNIECLPNDMVLLGSFIARECVKLKNMPISLTKIKGLLDISHSSISKLPDILEVTGNLNAPGLRYMKTLIGNKIIVGGNANFDDCKNLESFPNKNGAFKIGGSLYAHRCEMLKYLSPEEVKVTGSIYLDDSGIITFPEGWTLSGPTLSLTSCLNLTELKADKDTRDKRVFTCDLFMVMCPNLKILPDYLEVGSAVTLPRIANSLGIVSKNISPQSRATTQNNDIIEKTAFVLSMASELEKLPNKLIVNGTFRANNLDSLKELPECMVIRGNLSLSGNRQLSFTEDQKFGCVTSDSSIQKGIYVNGNIDLSNCSNIKYLPQNLLRIGYKSNGDIRTINLENTGLSKEYIKKLRQESSNYPGINFIYSTDRYKTEIKFASMEEAVKFWEDEAGTTHNPIVVEDLYLVIGSATSSREEKNIKKENRLSINNFLSFLTGLTATEDYKNAHTRKNLALFVVNILKRIAKLDNDYKRKAFASIVGATDSCSDRIAKGIDDLFRSVNLFEAFQSSQILNDDNELKKIARDTMIQTQINIETLNYINKSATVMDEVQEYIKINRGVSKRFNRDMVTIFFKDIDQAYADEELINSIYERIEKKVNDPVELEKFIDEWDMLNEFKRSKSMPEYELLPVLHVDRIEKCCITEHKSSQMVALVSYTDEGKIIKHFTYNAFKKEYILRGKNPFTTQKIDLSEVFRLEENCKKVPASSLDKLAKHSLIQNKGSHMVTNSVQYKEKFVPNYENLPEHYVVDKVMCFLSGETNSKMVVYEDNLDVFFSLDALRNYVINNGTRPFTDKKQDETSMFTGLLRVKQIETSSLFV